MKKAPYLFGAIAALALSGLASAPAAAAVDIPCTTAKLIVPWGAGGDTYIIFKVFEETVNRLNADKKIQVVTVPGQGGNKGAKEAVKAKPDGCTLVRHSSERHHLLSERPRRFHLGCLRSRRQGLQHPRRSGGFG